MVSSSPLHTYRTRALSIVSTLVRFTRGEWQRLPSAHLQGLHPGNMFACGVDFLLRLKPAALAPHMEQFEALRDPAPLKIGIHIRVGDRQLVSAFLCCDAVASPTSHLTVGAC